MRIYIDIVLFLYVNSVCSLMTDEIMDRLHDLEDKINRESTSRRDGFSTLYDEIESVKAMLQQSLENNAKEQDTDSVDIELVKTVEMLTKGFQEEKNWNMRFRREIPELQIRVQDLKTKTDQISASLEDILKGIEFLKDQKGDRQETFNLIQNKIPEIQQNILNLHEQFDQKKSAEFERLDEIKNDTEKIIETTKHLNHSQELCLESINININLTKRFEEKLVSGEEFCCKEKDSTTAETTLATSSTSTTTPTTPMWTYKSCSELYENGFRANAVYEIKTEQGNIISVYCDMTTDGGGWTVFQRRQDGSVDFFRTWRDYKTGFGDLTGEFWLGNEHLHQLTDNNVLHELRIELEDHDGNHAFAKYKNFMVGSESTKYKLEVSGYTGNAGDSLAKSGLGNGPHDQMAFTTKYRDNDYSRISNCAYKWHGAWWFNSCFDSHLNGLYHDQPNCEKEWKCIVWGTWKGSKYSLKSTEMKFRTVSDNHK